MRQDAALTLDASSLSFLFFPRGCFMPKPSLWPLHPHDFFFCSRHPFLLFPTGELMDTENKKPSCDRKINDDNLLVLPLRGWRPKALVPFLMFLSLPSAGEALQPPYYELNSRGGHSVPNGEKKAKTGPGRGKGSTWGAGWSALTPQPQFPHLQDGQKPSFTE